MITDNNIKNIKLQTKEDNKEFNKKHNENIDELISELQEEDSGCGFNILKWKNYLLVITSKIHEFRWSTLNENSNREQKLFIQSDSRIVKCVLRNQNILPEFLNKCDDQLNENYNFDNKVNNIIENKKLIVNLVPLGYFYRVNEYEGYETVELLDFNEWLQIN